MITMAGGSPGAFPTVELGSRDYRVGIDTP